MNSIGLEEKVIRNRIGFPCPACGHMNVPNPKPVEAIKLFLTDTIPNCKQCGSKMAKSDFRFPETSVYMKRARRELGMMQ